MNKIKIILILFLFIGCLVSSDPKTPYYSTVTDLARFLG